VGTRGFEPPTSAMQRMIEVRLRADERTRTAHLLQLRVRGQWLLSVAQVCESRRSKRLLVPSIAWYCVRVRVKLGSSDVSNPWNVRRRTLFKSPSRVAECGITVLALAPDTLMAEQSLLRQATGRSYRILDAIFGEHPFMLT